MTDPTETSAGEAVAAELSALLPRLPRVKITLQTISQTIIDRWYGYETEYRQTIAELRAELAAAREHAQTAHDQTAELGAEVVRLRATIADEHTRLSQEMENATEPISANDALQGTGSNEELWPILASHGAVSDPSDMRDSYLATVLINWRNASSKSVAGQYHEQRERAEKLEAELKRCAELNRELVNEAVAATTRAETAERELAEMRATLGEHKPGSHCPVCGTPMCLDLNGLVPAHERPTRGGYCSGTQRRPSEERLVGEWKAAEQQPEDGDHG